MLLGLTLIECHSQLLVLIYIICILEHVHQGGYSTVKADLYQILVS